MLVQLLRRAPRGTLKDKYTALSGGLNLTDPAITMRTGELIRAFNVEPGIRAGYITTGGYERFDGQSKPSDQSYWRIAITGGGAVTPAIGDTVSGGISGAIGIMSSAPDITSGAWATSDAAGYIMVTQLTGGFVSGEPITIGSATATTASVSVSLGADDYETEKGYLSDAADYQRELINKPAGQDAIRGVFKFMGNKYCFRDTEGATEKKMYKATAAGWVEVDLGQLIHYDTGSYLYTMYFDSGSAAPSVGDVLTGATSGATLIVVAVTLESGSWAGLDAAGYITCNYLDESENPWQVGEDADNTTTVTANVLTLVSTPGDGIFIESGDTITGGTSGDTAVVATVQLDATPGRLGEGTGQGTFVITGASGPFQSGEDLLVGGVKFAEAANIVEDITLTAGGRGEYVIHNFYGHTSQVAVYGVDGVNNAFQFDVNEVYTPIFTGMVNDTPTHVHEHHNHLMLMFSGGSNQSSSTGEPLSWNAITGASELAEGDEGVGYANAPRETLAIFGKEKVYILYGTDIDDFTLVKQPQAGGAQEWSIQDVNGPKYLSDIGLTDLFATDRYGDFEIATFSQRIKPLLDYKKESGVTCTASVVVRSKNLYRIFFSDGKFISAQFDGSVLKGFTESAYDNDGDWYVNCAWSGKNDDGVEETFIGCSNGFVYQCDIGTSFDGTEIPTFVQTPYNHFGTPQYNKRQHYLGIECEGETQPTVNFYLDYNYGDGTVPQSLEKSEVVAGPGGYWNLDDWDTFFWTSPHSDQIWAKVRGMAKNASLVIHTSSKVDGQLTVTGVINRYSARREVR